MLDAFQKLLMNNECWCGSGLKYRNCHYHDDKKRNIREIIPAFNKIFQKSICLYPESGQCEGKIIGAHSVQRARCLEQIADNGCVLQFSREIESIATFEKYSFCEPMPISINKATTFPGFCKKHDNDLFKLIDEGPIIPSYDQVALVTFRAISKELYVKMAAMNNIKMLGHFCSKYKRSHMEEYIDATNIGTESGLNEIRISYNTVWNIIKDHTCKLKFYAIVIDKIPDLFCSTCFQVDQDYNGNILNDISDLSNILDWISINIVADSKKGVIIFSWIDGFDDSVKLVESILKQNDPLNAIVNYLFINSENIAFSKSWWDALTIIKKKSICNKAYKTYSFPIEKDHKKYVDWNVIDVVTNFDGFINFQF